MIKYEERFLNSPYLTFRQPLYDGEQYIFHISENETLSVVRHYCSYGHESGLYELAKIVDYEIKGDVIGHLTVDEVLEIAEEEYRNS